MLSIILLLITTSSFANHIPNIHRIQRFAYGGLPVAQKVRSDFKILVNTGSAVGYSEKLKTPLWAVYRLEKVRPSEFMSLYKINTCQMIGYKNCVFPENQNETKER